MPSYQSDSPYYTTPLSSTGILGIWVPRNIPSSSDDTQITISSTYEYRPDLLANDLYGDSNLWWVFAMRNPNELADNPLDNFKSGLSIYVSSSATIKSALGV